MRYLLSMSFIFLMSCSSTKQTADAKKPATAANLKGTNWTLSAIPDFKMETLKKPAILHFDSAAAINGFSGCNGFGGSYTVDGNKLKMSNILGTMMACMPGMKTESSMYKALNNTDNYKISNGKLVLMQGDKMLAEFTPLKK